MYVLVCTVLLETTRPSIHMNKLIMLESCAHTVLIGMVLLATEINNFVGLTLITQS